MNKILIGALCAFMIIAAIVGYQSGVKSGEAKQVAVFKTLSPLFLTARAGGANDFTVYKGAKYEMLRVVFKDGAWYQVTSLHPVKIRTSAEDINQTVRVVFLRTLGDVTRIVHNHFLKEELPHSFTEGNQTYEIVDADPYVFSKADKDELANLRALGFTGEWCIFVGGKLIKYEEEK